jgi:putative transposase
MPWRETSALRERKQFITEWERERRYGPPNFAALCRAFSVSRQTGYKWLRRYLDAQGDVAALENRSRRPLTSPDQTPVKVVDLLVRARKLRPHWGPRTLRVWLMRQGVQSEELPAASTIGGILKREGLVRRRSRRRRTPPSSARPSVEADRPNAVWCVDFKGHFRTSDGMVCYPLTIIDAYSRYLIRCEATISPDERFVRRVFESAFREFGLPARMRSDNGTPFASVGPGGLSRLSVWWIKLGIRPERIQPGKPQQNGRQERFHRTLKRETAWPPRASLRAQQRAFDQFRVRYNEERPHQALGMVVPDELHVPSTRRFADVVSDPKYPPDWEMRRVNAAGSLPWKGRQIGVGAALAGQLVGLRPTGPEQFEVHFGPIVLGLIDENRSRDRLIRPVRRGRRPSAEVSAERAPPAVDKPGGASGRRGLSQAGSRREHPA